MLIMNSTKVTRLKTLLLGLPKADLEDWPTVLAAMDDEFSWSHAGEGWARYREYQASHKQGKPGDGMEDFLMHHEQRYERMRDLVHPDFDLPSELRGYQLLDAAGLSDDQLEKSWLTCRQIGRQGTERSGRS